jgi:hypothetical protein
MLFLIINGAARPIRYARQKRGEPKVNVWGDAEQRRPRPRTGLGRIHPWLSFHATVLLYYTYVAWAGHGQGTGVCIGTAVSLDDLRDLAGGDLAKRLLIGRAPLVRDCLCLHHLTPRGVRTCLAGIASA